MIDRQIGRQGDRQQSQSTNTAEVNAITETSGYFVAFHHHHLSRSLALSPSFMAGFLIDDKAIYVSLIPPSRLPPLYPPHSLSSPFCSSWSLSNSPSYLCFLCFIFQLFFPSCTFPRLSFSICVSFPFSLCSLSSFASFALASLFFTPLAPHLRHSSFSSPPYIIFSFSKHLSPSLLLLLILPFSFP